MLKILLTLLLVYHVLALVPNSYIIRRASRDILRQINNKKIPSSAGTEYPLIGGFARLTFHDCIGEGGCDGCLDMSRPPNAGLIRFITILDGLFSSKYAKKIFRFLRQQQIFMLWLLLLGWRKLPYIPKINFVVETN